MSDELLDARGVEIEPGDTAIYGFGVGRSIAMCEAVVLGGTPFHELTSSTTKVSLTPSGRVRLRVVRRSYSSGEKPVVDVAPDRLVVLKPDGATDFVLPLSPLPTQVEVAREGIELDTASYAESLRSVTPPDYWGHDMPGASPEIVLASYHAWCAMRLVELRRKLRALDGDQV